jgi:hypothetical protein
MAADALRRQPAATQPAHQQPRRRRCGTQPRAERCCRLRQARARNPQRAIGFAPQIAAAQLRRVGDSCLAAGRAAGGAPGAAALPSETADSRVDASAAPAAPAFDRTAAAAGGARLAAGAPAAAPPPGAAATRLVGETALGATTVGLAAAFFAAAGAAAAAFVATALTAAGFAAPAASALRGTAACTCAGSPAAAAPAPAPSGRSAAPSGSLAPLGV